jgi:hypothetical protein
MARGPLSCQPQHIAKCGGCHPRIMRQGWADPSSWFPSPVARTLARPNLGRTSGGAALPFGNCEGRKSHREKRPEVVALARKLRRKRIVACRFKGTSRTGLPQRAW